MLIDELLQTQREFEMETRLSIDDFLVDTKTNSTLNVNFKNFFLK
jgi:hypothetical protein